MKPRNRGRVSVSRKSDSVRGSRHVGEQGGLASRREITTRPAGRVGSATQRWIRRGVSKGMRESASNHEFNAFYRVHRASSFAVGSFSHSHRDTIAHRRSRGMKSAPISPHHLFLSRRLSILGPFNVDSGSNQSLGY